MIDIIFNKIQHFSVFLFHPPQHMASASWSKVAIRAPAVTPAFHSGGGGKEVE